MSANNKFSTIKANEVRKKNIISSNVDNYYDSFDRMAVSGILIGNVMSLVIFY